MKKIIKIIFCLIIVIALIIMPNQGFAASSSSDNPPPTFGDVLNAGSSFINSGVNSNTIVPTDESIRATSNLIYNVLSILGILIIIIWGMVLGIKFITGSVEQQAEYMQQLTDTIIEIGGFLVKVGQAYQEACENNANAING